MRTNRAATGAPARRGLLLAALAAPAASADTISAPIISGLPFRSGASFGTDCLAQLRNRPLDVVLSFLGHSSFKALPGYAAAMARGAGKAPLWVVSVPLLTDNTKGQFAQCAAGAFDGYFRQVGANLVKGGAQATVARLGHEANSGTHAWGVTSAAQVPAYKACWRRAALALKAGGPGLLVEWTNAKKGKLPALSMYPGDDVVDLWGVHYYDTGPEKSTQATWDKYLNATYQGGPWGLGAWLAAAKAHGKRLGVGEWGVWATSGNPAPDDPVYMDNMYRFLSANAGGIAYEAYFNATAGNGGHALCPGTRFPRATATYKAEWGK
jgi:hypothetical protein